MLISWSKAIQLVEQQSKDRRVPDVYVRRIIDEARKALTTQKQNVERSSHRDSKVDERSAENRFRVAANELNAGIQRLSEMLTRRDAEPKRRSRNRSSRLRWAW